MSGDITLSSLYDNNGLTSTALENGALVRRAFEEHRHGGNNPEIDGFVAACEAHLEALTLTALSRTLGTRNADEVQSWQLCKALGLYGATETVHAGRVRPAIAHVKGPFPSSISATRRLMDAGLLDATAERPLKTAFDSADLQRKELACLETEVVEAYVPRDLWPVVAGLITDGRAVAANRLETALVSLAHTPVRGNSRNGSGTASYAAVSQARNVLQALMKQLVWLTDREYHSPFLSPWDTVPRITLPQLPDTARRYKTAGPRLNEVRDTIFRLEHAIHRILGVGAIDEELDMLRSWDDAKVARSGLAQYARNRAAIVALVLTGGRSGAVRRLRRSHLVENFAGSAPDYRDGWALLLEPRKGHDLYMKRPKVIPDQAATMLLFNLEVVDAVRRERYPDFVAPPPSRDPLLLAGVAGSEPLSASSLTAITRGPAGAAARDKVAAKAHAGTLKSKRYNLMPASVLSIIPRDERDLAAGVPEEHRPFIGRTAHEMRHFAYQATLVAADLWNKENSPPPGEREHDAELYASAVADHKDRSLAAVYGDTATERAYEVLSGRAIGGLWKLLRGESGQRKRPNIKVLREKAEQLAQCEQEMQTISAEAKRLGADQMVRSRRSQELSASSKPAWSVELSDSKKLDLALRHLEALREQNAVLINSSEDLRALAGANLAALGRLHELTFKHGRLLTELNDLFHNEEHWETVPDDAPEGAEKVDPGFLRELLSPALVPERLQQAAVRDWLTFVEFGAIFGVKRRQVCNWVDGRQQPRIALWDVAAPPPVDEHLGKSRRRIWVPGLRAAIFQTERYRRERDRLLCVWPDSQLWTSDEQPNTAALTPLQLRSPHAEAYALSQLAREPEES